jgi:hypothetical protein
MAITRTRISCTWWSRLNSTNNAAWIMIPGGKWFAKNAGCLRYSPGDFESNVVNLRLLCQVRRLGYRSALGKPHPRPLP